MTKKNTLMIILFVALILFAIAFVFVARRPIQKDDSLKTGNKILYYRNPMNPAVTSPVPMKDSMGMDYVPVYAVPAGRQEEGISGEAAGIYISPEKQQLIGVTKEKVEKRHLSHQIITVGEVAYDPDLYVAQEEYLQALKTVTATKNSILASTTERTNSLLSASGKKLLLLGMSKQQIDELAKRGSAQENLYLPIGSQSVWAYVTVYEYEIGLIKEGTSIEIEAVAFPGETFKGKITAITPVLNAATRAIRVRAEIENPEHKLRPKMFVNARINVDLGEKLAVPETAVLDTGLRKIAYVVRKDDTFEHREVTLGQKALGYFEVLGGLNEGDTVVTSGNFLVDSESKLRSAPQETSENKQGH
jgi:Cu(I)/Ag(I) efflux system membrane fusion protein